MGWLSLGSGMRLYLGVALVGFEGSPRRMFLGYIWYYKIYDMKIMTVESIWH